MSEPGAFQAADESEPALAAELTDGAAYAAGSGAGDGDAAATAPPDGAGADAAATALPDAAGPYAASTVPPGAAVPGAASTVPPDAVGPGDARPDAAVAALPDAPGPDVPGFDRSGSDVPGSDAVRRDIARLEAADALAAHPPAAHPLAARAAALDDADPLAGVRDRFALDDDTVYLDGNSLGALPAGVLPRLADVVTREWGELRIRSWEESGWWTAPERIGDRLAPLIGAAPGQVVVGDSTSVNVFKALVAAVRMAPPGRTEILVDSATFPTDGYIAASAARLTGHTVRAVPAAEIAAAASERTAVALVNHVDYRTGRLYDLPGTTAALHAAGALAVWDLCHSAGALPVALDAHGVDLAVGCTYKYLNGGPGAPAYLYVRTALQPRFDSPLPGWNSHADPFGMTSGYEPAQGAPRGRVGTPEILSLLALDAALDVWDGVAVADVRAKSLALTDFFLDCVAALVPAGRVDSVTPAAHPERGSQISLRCAGAREVMRELTARGVVGDFRQPDVLRFGFTPLYTRYADACCAARVLADVIEGTA